MDIALKQRLVGAIVLIALAVVVLPMLLGGRPEDGAQEAQTIELPPQPGELDFETRRYPVGETPAIPSRAPEDGAAGDAPVTLPHRSPEPVPATDADPRAVAHVELEPREFRDALEEGNAAVEGTGPLAAEATAEPTAEPAAVPKAAATQTPPPTAAPAATSGSGRYAVQVASFGSINNANRLADTLQAEEKT